MNEILIMYVVASTLFAPMCILAYIVEKIYKR